MRNILAVGAYERDNFGDFLFYEVLSRALPDDNVLPGSVISGDMRDSYGFITTPYDFILKRYEIDAVWVAGGEVGGVDVPSAIDMSVGNIFQGTQYSYDDKVAAKVEELLGASRRNKRAYIPDLGLYEINKLKPLIVQSVGLNNVFLGAPDNVGLLKSASRLVVRESRSYKLCKDNDLNVVLAPDVVHSLAKLYKPSAVKDVGVLIQINKALLDRYDIEEVRKVFRDVSVAHKLPLTLFAAGTANGHDSLGQYEGILQGLEDIDIKILDTRKPLEMVDNIASASIVIGTSLHARIVSATYDVPRISLENDKTSNYAMEWDGGWPHGVTLENLNETLCDINFVEHVKKPDSKLTELAYDELMRSVATIPDGKASTPVIGHDAIALDWLIYQQSNAVKSIIEAEQGYDKIVAGLRSELEEGHEREDGYNREIQSILMSKSYRIGRAILSPFRFIKRMEGVVRGGLIKHK